MLQIEQNTPFENILAFPQFEETPQSEEIPQWEEIRQIEKHENYFPQIGSKTVGYQSESVQNPFIGVRGSPARGYFFPAREDGGWSKTGNSSVAVVVAAVVAVVAAVVAAVVVGAQKGRKAKIPNVHETGLENWSRRVN